MSLLLARYPHSERKEELSSEYIQLHQTIVIAEQHKRPVSPTGVSFPCIWMEGMPFGRKNGDRHAHIHIPVDQIAKNCTRCNRHSQSFCLTKHTLTFQSSEVTSLLLGTSWPPSRMQCLRTSWVDPPVLFSLRFQIRAVESPDLPESKHTH